MKNLKQMDCRRSSWRWSGFLQVAKIAQGHWIFGKMSQVVEKPE